jgi:putative ATP-dependent endonuclease of the OLD family
MHSVVILRRHTPRLDFENMRISTISIQNFRSIEQLSIDLPGHYTAISGKNNSGKSNLLRPLKILFEPEQRFRFSEDEIKHSQHFPLWKNKDSDEHIRIEASLTIARIEDASVFKLAEEFFKLEETVQEIELHLSAEYHKGKEQPDYVVKIGEDILDSYKSKTIFTTIKTSGAFQFYNSTEPHNPFVSRNHLTDLVGELSKSDRKQIVRDRDKFSKTVLGLAKKHQKDVSDLLGRLEEKYSVGLSVPKMNVDFLPINITLGDKRVDVSLDEWGSGTKNRTYILLALFKAKKLSESLDDDTKISPILIIEEPESFLHPSAQAEFGRIIQDLSEEFKVQVIVATHSPYFLSQQRPESNILLSRKLSSGQLRATEKIPIESSNWMEPFALNLGLSNPEFESWKPVFFSKTNKILLVEGEIDKEYFDLLRDEVHGSNKLSFDGEIYQYGGTGTIQNGVLLRFIKGRYHRFFVTFDLDCENQLSKLLQSLGMEKGKHFAAVGANGGGREKIEGLLPDSVKNAVYGKHGALVQQALAGTGDESKSAKQKLKRLLFVEFKTQAHPGQDYYGEFYKLVKVINKAMQ